MAKPGEHVEHHTRGLGDGKDRHLGTHATLGSSDHNRQIIHNQHRTVSENHTRQSNYERRIIKGLKVRPTAKRGIRRKVSQKRREKEKEDIEELNTIEVSAPRQRKPKKAKLIHKRSRKGKVGTLDHYRYENEDGSITWGYQNDDGGYKVESLRKLKGDKN